MSWFGNHRCMNSAIFGFLILSLPVSAMLRSFPVTAAMDCRQIPNELIIQFQPDFPITETPAPDWPGAQIPPLDSLSATANLLQIIQLTQPHSVQNPEKSITAGYRLIFGKPLNFPEILPRLNQNKNIVFAEPNYCYSAASLPQPPSAVLPTGLLARLDLAAARSVKARKNRVVIGLIDPGFSRTDSIPPGKFSDWCHPAGIIHLKDTTAFTTKTEPGSNHGYRLGDVIQRFLSELKNETAPAIKILPVIPGTPRSDSNFQLCATGCAAAIEYVVLHQAKIILLGWSGPGPSKFLENSSNWAVAQGALIIAAAGNQNQKTPVYPAAWPRVLAVAATDGRDLKTPNSNFGDWVDVSAPGNWGETIPSNQPGTSIAAAVVAGLAALIQATERDLAPDSLRRRIIFSCDNIDSLNPNYAGLLGAGRVNALRSIKGISQPNIILREHQFELVKTSDGSDSTGIPARQRLVLIFENIAADARSVSIEITNLPAAIQVIPARIQLPDFKFHQIKKCEFWVQSPREWNFGAAQIKVLAHNAAPRTIPIKTDLAPVASTTPDDSLNHPGVSDQRIQYLDFQPRRIVLLPGVDSPARIFVLGSDSTAQIKGAFWQDARPSLSFDLKLDSLTTDLLFTGNFSADGFRQVHLNIADLNAAGIPDWPGLPEDANELQIEFGNENSILTAAVTRGITAADFEVLPLDSEFSNDLAVVASQPSGMVLKIYQNHAGQFSMAQEIALPPIQKILPGDLDQDHDFDLLLIPENAPPQIWLNNGQANFTQTPVGLTPDILSDGVLLDFNGDGTLDLAGIHPEAPYVKIYLNPNSARPRPELPAVPENLHSTTDSTRIFLNWDPPAQAATPGWTYELSLRTGTPATEKIVLNPFKPGNLGQARQFWFTAEPGKKYYWTVQTVDAGHHRSAWAPLQSVQLPAAPPKIFAFWPRQDTTLTPGDSLRFQVKADSTSGSLLIHWRTHSDQTGTKPTFTYQVPAGRRLPDSVWVTGADRDTAFQYGWQIKIRRTNQPPRILAFFPADDSPGVREGDSLLFKIRARDADQDSLVFHWLHVSDKKIITKPDSVLWVKWNYFSAATDSIGVRVADADTAIVHWWHILVKNTNRAPEIRHRFPRSDTTLVSGDSLQIRFEIFEPDSQPVTISWHQNDSVVVDSGTQTFYRYLARTGFSQPDTIVACISDGDTTVLRQWIIATGPALKITHFWPARDTLLMDGDSLEFRVRASGLTGDSLTYSWSINRQHYPASDSLFRYQAIFSPPGIDSVKIQVAYRNSQVSHAWQVRIQHKNIPPSPPEPRFPRLGEVVPESGKLQWRPAKDPDPADRRLTYFVQIATDSAFSAICTADSVKADSVLALQECTGWTHFESGKTYFWRVLAVDCCRDTSRFSRTRAWFRFQHISARIAKAYAKNNTENGITIFWETVQEKGNLGFNILRKTAPNGEFRRLNEMLIRGTSPYSHLDGDVQAGAKYFYCIECVSVTGLTFRHDVIEVSAPVPEAFALHQNYPNPLTFETLIRFEIPRECQVSLSVYNILGEEVRRLVKETREKGFYDVIWNGRDENDLEVGSGIYFYSITAENFHETRKIMVVR